MAEWVQHLLSNFGTTIGGVVLGWWLSEASEKMRMKPHLVAALSPTPDKELVEKEYRTKTSASEMGVEIFNTGRVSVIVEKFCLHRNNMIVDCFLDGDDRKIKPSENVTYTLDEQEYDALKHHCYKSRMKWCYCTAYTVGGKQIKSRVDLEGLLVMLSLQDRVSL